MIEYVILCIHVDIYNNVHMYIYISEKYVHSPRVVTGKREHSTLRYVISEIPTCV